MTGWPALEHRAVWRLAAPLMLGNVCTALLGLADTAVAGRLPAPHYLGAVAVASVLFDVIYWSAGFLRMSATGIVARMHGSADGDGLRAALAQSLASAGAIAVGVIVAQALVAAIGFALIDGSDAVLLNAQRYFDVAIWGAPAVLANFALFGWFIGVQDAASPLIVLVLSNLLNVVLNVALVFGLGYDVDGLAAATVIAQYAGAALGFLLVRRRLRTLPGRWRRDRMIDRRAWRALWALNGHIFVRTAALIGTFAFFTSQGARQGDVAVAANAVLLKFIMLMSLSLDGLAHAAEALVGAAIGARDRVRMRVAVASAGFWSLLFAAAYSAAYLALGQSLVALLTTLDAVRGAAREFLPWLAAAPLIAVWCYLLDGIFIGAARGRAMRDTMLIAAIAVFLPVWWLARPLGNHGLWLALMAFYAARGFGLAWHYRRLDRTNAWFAH